MSHEIDLEKFQVRCDLISESLEVNQVEGLRVKKKKYKNIVCEEVMVEEENEAHLGKKKGIYMTISFQDVTDVSNRKELVEVVSKMLEKILKQKKLLGKKCLVVGLGNPLSTPDALGPKVLEEIIVTRHLFDLQQVSVEEGYSNVSIFSPGVYASTGIESFDLIQGVVKATSPDYVIAIDALASSSIEKVNRVIQITDSGIEPGSGIGNNRKEISEESLAVPVIAIGIPTVVDAVTIVSDTINFLMKKISYHMTNMDNPKDKLTTPDRINFLNTEYNLDEEERKMYLGLLGELKEEEKKELFLEVLTPIGYNFMVTPKEVDFVLDKLAFVLSKSLNQVLHQKLKQNDKNTLM